MLKIPEKFDVSVERQNQEWVAVDRENGGVGFGKTPGEALRNFAEGLEVATRINQRAALLNDDATVPN